MRAAILLIPFAAFVAALSAGGGRSDPAANDAAGNDAMMAADEMGLDAMMEMNAVEAAADAALWAATNTTGEARPNPAWMSGGTWLYAGESATGAIWYFEALDSDFLARPMRVLIRVDETPDPARTNNNTARTAEVDCEARRYRILRTVEYDDSGNASEADERGDGSMVPIAPNSVFAVVAEGICLHAAAQESMSGEATQNGM